MDTERMTSEAKKGAREADEKIKETWRKADGEEDLGDKVGNLGDDVRNTLGNAGDKARDTLDDAGDKVKESVDQRR